MEQSESHSTVKKKWFVRCRDGNFSLEDDSCPTTIKKFEELQVLYWKEIHVKLKKKKTLQNSYELLTKQYHFSLHAMEKIQKRGKWIPHLFTEENKNQDLTSARIFLHGTKEKKIVQNHCSTIPNTKKPVLIHSSHQHQ
ncbi:hypothetical protein TNCT_421261 [Trichonephila clavata]|uniref:Uncharacterized protein n=1 Tax=Trichonephila clavata TaxID=2740835 RepID=A0A8X6JAK7_TRICU|nr:hypothetical protein TNCT_421261 [Trichonephila clavata]